MKDTTRIKLAELGYPTNWKEFWFCLWYQIKSPFAEINELVKATNKYRPWAYGFFLVGICLLVIKIDNSIWFFLVGFVMYILSEIRMAKWKKEYKDKYIFKRENTP